MRLAGRSCVGQLGVVGGFGAEICQKPGNCLFGSQLSCLLCNKLKVHGLRLRLGGEW